MASEKFRLIEEANNILMANCSAEEQSKMMAEFSEKRKAQEEKRMKQKGERTGQSTLKPIEQALLSGENLNNKVGYAKRQIPIDIDAMIEDDEVSFGEVYRRLRRSKKLSIKEAAEAIGVSTVPVSRAEKIENDLNSPAKDTLKKLGHYYGLSNEQLRLLGRKNPWVGIKLWNILWEKDEPHLTVGGMFSILRERKGLTLSDIASKTLIHHSNVVRLENGNLISPETAQKYLKALEINEDEFYNTLIVESNKMNQKFMSMLIDP